MMLDSFYSRTLVLVAYNLVRLKSLCYMSPSPKIQPNIHLCQENELRGKNILFSWCKMQWQSCHWKNKAPACAGASTQVFRRNKLLCCSISLLFFCYPTCIRQNDRFLKMFCTSSANFLKPISSVQIRWGRYIPNPFSHKQTELLSML